MRFSVPPVIVCLLLLAAFHGGWAFTAALPIAPRESSPQPHFTFDVVDWYSNDQQQDPQRRLLLGDFLCSQDPVSFPSKSRAKRACNLCSIAVWGSGSSSNNVTREISRELASSCGGPPILSIPISSVRNSDVLWAIRSVVESRCNDDEVLRFPTTPHYLLDECDIVVVVDRVPDGHYPANVTKYVLPPPRLFDEFPAGTTGGIHVVFEDDVLAVVVKPENLTTIATTSTHPYQDGGDDLQSCLGFLLHPSPLDMSYHPRPVHRLDKGTSGLVVVAKTRDSMRHLSASFASRRVVKTYGALVRWKECQECLDFLYAAPNGKDGWRTIDYPIDGRKAVTEWRLHASWRNNTSTTTKDEFALLEVRPHHGRMHQIRRHLSYCLGMSIVGDTKYGKCVSSTDKRHDGMFLCCFSLEFPYPHKPSYDNAEWAYDSVHKNDNCEYERSHGVNWDATKKTLQLSTPLPAKFTNVFT